MATRGSLGGLAEAALQAALLMDASGKDDVLLETVGVGQGEIDIVDHADTIVLALMPGSGDSVQALKAGVMEIPDVIVVNKCDHPLADTMVREVRGVLSLGPQGPWKVPVVRTEATKGEGIAELLERIDAHRAAHRGDRVAGRAPGPQPTRRGAGDRHGTGAAPARGSSRDGPRVAGTAGQAWCGAKPTRPRRRGSCSRTRADELSDSAAEPAGRDPKTTRCPASLEAACATRPRPTSRRVLAGRPGRVAVGDDHPGPAALGAAATRTSDHCANGAKASASCTRGGTAPACARSACSPSVPLGKVPVTARTVRPRAAGIVPSATINPQNGD